MSLVNVYWIRTWATVYFCSLISFPSPPSPPAILVCLLSAAIHHDWDMRGGPHTFDEGMERAVGDIGARNSAQSCVNMFTSLEWVLLYASYLIFGLELQCPGPGLNPSCVLSDWIVSATLWSQDHQAIDDQCQTQRGEITCPSFTEIVHKGTGIWASECVISEPEFLSLFNSNTIISFTMVNDKVLARPLLRAHWPSTSTEEEERKKEGRGERDQTRCLNWGLRLVHTRIHFLRTILFIFELLPYTSSCLVNKKHRKCKFIKWSLNGNIKAVGQCTLESSLKDFCWSALCSYSRHCAPTSGCIIENV